MNFYYLCSPYSHADPAVRQARFDAACKVAARLMREGNVVFSPIAHSHPIEQHLGEVEAHDFWMWQDLPILRHAAKVLVLRLDGWEASKGIALELEAAGHWKIPVEHIDP